MSSLRRDLLERKLWPLVALLLAGVVAVPLLLLKGASAAGTPTAPPPPPAAVTAPSAGHAPATEPAKVLLARIARSPFASGTPKLAAKPASQAQPAASPSAAATATTTTTATMVSPSPSTTSSQSATPTSTTATTPTSSTHSTPTPVSTTASAPPEIPVKVQSWTTYSVGVRFGRDASAPIKNNLARLTPLPSARQPEIMFMGVMAGGRQAVFALGAGLQHTGPGLCRPSHTQCSAILLKAGQTEHIVVPAAAGGQPQQLILRLVHIASIVTHSQKAALAAYQRHSAVGLCELALADPVSYSQTSGTVANVARAACRHQAAAVPFRSPVTAP